VLLTIAERFRDVLVPFLIAGTSILVLMLLVLVGQRLVRAAAEARRRSLADRYRSIIDAALGSDSARALDDAAAIPARHRSIAANLVLATLRVVRGGHNDRARALAERLDLTGAWRDGLGSRFWWHRAEAALALGLLHDKKAVPMLTALLDDDHEQVRAAAIDALGQIGDSWAITPLLARLNQPARHERARLVQALRGFGDRATRALVLHGQREAGDRALVATVLSYVGGAGAQDALLEWAAAPDAETRVAVWSALATIGLNERAFYHAIKALNADESPVRATAARALARSGRADAVPQLAGKLDDDWEVAAQSARALSRLGAEGQAALQRRIDSGAGLGHDLARQVLWESSHR
jgi:HEAT repeat protein